MTDERKKLFYALALVALMALVALARHDLFLRAFHTTMRQMGKGPAVQAKLLGEIVLFALFLILTVRTIPAKIRPKRDAGIFLAAALAGYLAEAWGTRAGLWRYYTRETPPLWIVPAWSIGALIFDRVSERARETFAARISASSQRAGYWILAALALVVFALFSRPALLEPAGLAMFAALAAALLYRPEPERDFWVMATGVVYVMFADFWGTTNNCWRYYLQEKNSLPTLLAGVSFGMLFDATVILGCLRLCRVKQIYDG